MQPSKPFRLLMVAAGQCLMVLPATVFLAAAAMRLLQPRQYEPARTSWLIFGWIATHISRSGAAMLLIGLPGLVALAGCAALIAAWREDPTFRHDAALALAIVRRNLAMALLIASTVLAVAVVTFAVTHAVAG